MQLYTPCSLLPETPPPCLSNYDALDWFDSTRNSTPHAFTHDHTLRSYRHILPIIGEEEPTRDLETWPPSTWLIRHFADSSPESIVLVSCRRRHNIFIRHMRSKLNDFILISRQFTIFHVCIKMKTIYIAKCMIIQFAAVNSKKFRNCWHRNAKRRTRSSSSKLDKVSASSSRDVCPALFIFLCNPVPCFRSSSGVSSAT